MHTIHHDHATTISSDAPLYDAAQLESTDGLTYSLILDGVEYRSSMPMHVGKFDGGIYSDAYLFDVATRMLESGMDTIAAVDKLMHDCHIDHDRALRIVGIAFDPSSAYGA